MIRKGDVFQTLCGGTTYIVTEVREDGAYSGVTIADVANETCPQAYKVWEWEYDIPPAEMDDDDRPLDDTRTYMPHPDPDAALGPLRRVAADRGVSS